MRRGPQSQRGFTLIELMTVIAIIGVIMGVLATFSTGGGVATPKNTSESVVSMLSLARQRAIATRTIHRVQFDYTNDSNDANDTISMWMSNLEGFQTPGGYNLVQSMAVLSGVVIWRAQAAIQATPLGAAPIQLATVAFTIDFLPDGTSTGGTVFLTDNAVEHQHRVFVYRASGNSQTRELW